jgi:hypothetical protein
MGVRGYEEGFPLKGLCLTSIQVRRLGVVLLKLE